MSTDVNQSLPESGSLNISMYVVQAGFQDYFFPLYYMKSTTRMLINDVPSVISGISNLLKVSNIDRDQLKLVILTF